MESLQTTGTILNAIFTVVMLLLAWADWRSFGTDNHKDFKSIIMSTGVLGTFVGIFVGLIGFDATKVTDSIPLLLDGLKVAFYTSIVGMGVAITLSIVQKGRKGVVQASDDGNEYLNHQIQKLDMLVRLDDLKHLLSIFEMWKDYFKNEQVRLDAQKNEENERFLLMQNILQSGFANVENSLNNAVEKLAKTASEGMVEALANVIRDFNANLNEQFGQNFVEFNEAVGEMVVWQRDYQVTLNNTKDALTKIYESFVQSSDSLEQIAARNKEVMEFYSDLKAFMKEIECSAKELRLSLDGLVLLKDDAKESLVNVRSLFEESVQNIGTLAQRLQQGFQESEEEFTKRIKQFGDNSTATVQHLTQNLITHSEILKNHIAHNSDALKESFVMLGDNVKSFSRHLNNEIVGIYSNASQQIHNDSEQFTQKMTEQSQAIQLKISELSHTGEESFARLHDNLRLLAQTNSDLLASSLQNSQNIFEQRSKKIEQLLTTNSEQFQNSVSRLTGNVTDAIAEMSNGLRGLSSGVRDNMLQTLEVMREEMLKMTNLTKEGMTAGANAMVRQNRTFLEGIGNQTKEFFTKSLDEWQSEQKQAIAGIVQNFNELTQDLSKNLTHLDDSLADGINDIKDSLRNLLAGVVEELKRGSEEYNNASLKVLESSIGQISTQIVALQETSHQSLEKIAQEYLTQFKNLMNDSVSVPKEASMKILDEIESLQKGIAANLLAANQSILNNKEEVRTIIENLNAHLQNQLTSTEQLSSNLYHSIQSLDESMAKLTDSFKGDYEWFLRRIGDFMGSHRS